jgi:hypothetical protein
MSINWLNYLQVKYNIFIQHACNKGEFYISSIRYKADGYCKENNTIYEFLGDFWHSNPKFERYAPENINPKNNKTYGELYNNTQNRKNEIIKLGFNYIEIWESDWLLFLKNVVKIQKIWKSKKTLKS